MATTTNYGWTTPDDTALVKDGAAAIRTLGSSVDTTTKALNPSTTLGDIEYRSSTANTNTRLGIGSTGNVLTVAGGVPTWAAPAAGGMTLLSTTSASGSSFTISTIDQTYKDLVIYGRGLYASAQLEMSLRLNGDSGSNYAFSFFGAAGETAYANWSGGGTSAKFTWIDDNSSYNQRTNFNLIIPRYVESGTRYISGVSYAYKDANTLPTVNTSVYNSSTAVSSITFLLPSGSFTAGTIYIYGVK